MWVILFNFQLRGTVIIELNENVIWLWFIIKTILVYLAKHPKSDAKRVSSCLFITISLQLAPFNVLKKDELNSCMFDYINFCFSSIVLPERYLIFKPRGPRLSPTISNIKCFPSQQLSPNGYVFVAKVCQHCPWVWKNMTGISFTMEWSVCMKFCCDHRCFIHTTTGLQYVFVYVVFGHMHDNILWWNP